MSLPNQRNELVLYTTTWCGDCRRSKRWLNENGIGFHEINIDEDETGADTVRRLNQGNETVPTILFPDGSVLAEPSNRQLALKIEMTLGIATPEAQRARG